MSSLSIALHSPEYRMYRLLKYSKVAYAALTGTKEEHDGPGGTASGRWKAVPRSVVAG